MASQLQHRDEWSGPILNSPQSETRVVLHATLSPVLPPGVVENLGYYLFGQWKVVRGREAGLAFLLC